MPPGHHGLPRDKLHDLTIEQGGPRSALVAAVFFRYLGTSVKKIHFIETKQSDLLREVYFENCKLLRDLLVQKLIVTQSNLF